MSTLLIGTTNHGKLREYGDLLQGSGVEVGPLPEFPAAPAIVEDGDTFAANAAKKALTLAAFYRRPVLSDDSGLEVDALDGAPGLLSARYAGPGQDSDANVDKLLRALAGVPLAQRTARFRCAIAVAAPDGRSLVVEGECEGLILGERRGGGGFGYDPIFLDPASGLTFAEMSDARKNEISHRGRAVRRLREDLATFVGVETKEKTGIR